MPRPTSVSRASITSGAFKRLASGGNVSLLSTTGVASRRENREAHALGVGEDAIEQVFDELRLAASFAYFDDGELDGIAGCESQVLQVVLRFGVGSLEDEACR